MGAGRNVMRALLKRFGLARDEGPDPELAGAAETIVANLRALGLFVAAKAYGPHFVEIVASTSPKLVTTPGSAEASGVALLLAHSYDPPTLVFEEINSLQPGLGRRMVEAVLQGLAAAPKGPFRKIRVDDASPLGRDASSFWRRIAAEHARLAWEITENERVRPPCDPRLDGSIQKEA
jgi:hypothetical protein